MAALAALLYLLAAAQANASVFIPRYPDFFEQHLKHVIINPVDTGADAVVLYEKVYFTISLQGTQHRHVRRANDQQPEQHKPPVRNLACRWQGRQRDAEKHLWYHTKPVTTSYINTADGKQLAMYKKTGSTLALVERYLYGSERIALLAGPNGNTTSTLGGPGPWTGYSMVTGINTYIDFWINVTTGARWYSAPPPLSWGVFNPHIGNPFALVTTFGFGQHSYELHDHLGNVRAVVSDTKSGSSAVVKSYYNYYAFGGMIGAKSSDGGGYRFGFNGQERDDMLAGGTPSGVGVDYAFKFREYNAALGRFMSIDPLARQYPWNSPYSFAENDVTRSMDLEGLEKYIIHNYYLNSYLDKTTVIRLVDHNGVNQNMDMIGHGQSLKDNEVMVVSHKNDNIVSVKGYASLSKREAGIVKSDATKTQNIVDHMVGDDKFEYKSRTVMSGTFKTNEWQNKVEDLTVFGTPQSYTGYVRGKLLNDNPTMKALNKGEMKAKSFTVIFRDQATQDKYGSSVKQALNTDFGGGTINFVIDKNYVNSSVIPFLNSSGHSPSSNAIEVIPSIETGNAGRQSNTTTSH